MQEHETVIEGLRGLGLIGENETPALVPLDGGVSSDIWRAETRRGTVCVKRALPRLRTTKEWRVPVERNANEADWIRAVGAIAPDAVPRLAGEDRDRGLFAMKYLDPTKYPVWKAQLRDGEISPDIAATVGAALGTIHAATAGNEDLAKRFATDALFEAIRIEPYLLRTAEAHPDLAGRLRQLAKATAENRRALVHGDVSPKNILVGPGGPLFLDAECAWYGDPAFDLAFCLNHLLLKCLWTPPATPRFLACFGELAGAYLRGAAWERPEGLEARAAALLPGLLLARVDGKSPVEYVTADDDRNLVRGAARRLLRQPAATLAAVREVWASSLSRGALPGRSDFRG